MFPIHWLSVSPRPAFAGLLNECIAGVKHCFRRSPPPGKINFLIHTEMFRHSLWNTRGVNRLVAANSLTRLMDTAMSEMHSAVRRIEWLAAISQSVECVLDCWRTPLGGSFLRAACRLALGPLLSNLFCLNRPFLLMQTFSHQHCSGVHRLLVP